MSKKVYRISKTMARGERVRFQYFEALVEYALP
jgi:hypothetical protein